MISLTELSKRYENIDNVTLNNNLKQNTVEDIQAYQATRLSIIPLNPYTKEPCLTKWTSGDSITPEVFLQKAKPNGNYGLRLDYQFVDGNYLVSIDIEDTAKEDLLKHFVDALGLDVNNLPWTRTQSGAIHLYLKTDRELTSFQMSGSNNEGVVVELRSGNTKQNVIGPSIYKEEDSEEEREYITYGNILDAPYVDADLIMAAFAELGEIPKPRDSSSTGTNTISFREIADIETEQILIAIEFLRTKRITREDWILCGFALINHFRIGAIPYFLMLSCNPHFKEDTYESVMTKIKDLLKTVQTKPTIQTSTIGTLFHVAKKYGFKIDSGVANY